MPYSEAHLAQELNFQLRQSPVLPLITNDRYEGEIERPEDTVTITRPSSTTIKNYNPNEDLEIEEMDGSDATLSMDHQKYFAFYAPRGKNLSMVAEDFAENEFQDLVLEAEEYVLGKYAQAESQVDVAADATSSEVLAAVRQAATKLNTTGASRAGRWMVVDSAAELALMDALSDRESSLGDVRTQSGYIGQLAGFNVFSRETVSTSGSYRHAVAGTTGAITYAEAISEVSIVEAESRIGKRVAGVHIAGAKVIKPEALCDVRFAVSS